MIVNLAGSIYGPGFYYKDSEEIDGINNNLIKIEKELYSSNEPDKRRKSELNNEVFGFINKIEDMLRKNKGLTDISKKNLQILNIKFGMAAMKSGNTDWESFNLSREVYENNEFFLSKNASLLSCDDLRRQKIAKENRDFSWNCCQYNFACNLIYTDMPAPAYNVQEGFLTYFDECKKSGVSDKIAVAVANVEVAKKLCESSFGTEEGSSDTLSITIKRLSSFYRNYINYFHSEMGFNLKLEESILSNSMSVFIPEEIKEKLDALDIF